MALLRIQPKRDLPVASLLDDLERHLPENHDYRSSDKINYAHEATHGVNAGIRNDHGSGKNAAYLLGDMAWVLDEPDRTLAAVARVVPASLRGGGYDLYLVKQQRYWNDQPLYILDEWTAYRHGTLLGDEAHCATIDISFSFSKQIEMLGYFFILAAVAGELDRVAVDMVARVTQHMLKLGEWNGWATAGLKDQLDHVLTFQPASSKKELPNDTSDD